MPRSPNPKTGHRVKVRATATPLYRTRVLEMLRCMEHYCLDTLLFDLSELGSQPGDHASVPVRGSTVQRMLREPDVATRYGGPFTVAEYSGTKCLLVRCKTAPLHTCIEWALTGGAILTFEDGAATFIDRLITEDQNGQQQR